MRALSAVIITLNEERNIARCLQSLQGVTDDVVVVDGHSTDRTVAICTAFGARVVQHHWLGYSATKNFANGLALHDLVLSIDADEALSPELAKSILNTRAETGTAYTMNRLTNYCGHWIHHTGWYPDCKLRLFDRRMLHWEGLVHETLVPKANQPQHLKGDLHHYSYYTVAEHVAQTNRFSTLSAAELMAQGKRPAAWRMVFSPLVMFLRFYFVRFGFLDGAPGLMVSVLSAYGSFLKHAKHLMGQGE